MIRLLGPVDAVIQGQRLELGAPRQRRLIVALVLGEGRTVSVDQLIDAMWEDGEALPANPRNTVQQYVSHLRTVLGADSIASSAAGYQLVGESSDAAEFERGLAEARSHHARGDLAGAEAALSAATDLWRGAAFGDLSDATAFQAERLRLEELRLAGADLAMELQLGAGDAAGAAAAAEAALIDHPLREAPVATLATARQKLGQQAEALRAIAAFRERLATETGLEISEQLAALERHLLGDEAPGPVATRKLRGYDMEELIGEGAFGSIYRATQPSIGREVAIKVVRPELADDPRFIRRFEAEAQMVARMEHPHVVPLFDYWREPGGAFLVMRYLRGGSAEQRLVSNGPLSLDQTSRLVDEIGGALAAAHSTGIVHRDVKPANLLYDEFDNSYLADFGIAIADGTRSELELRSAGSPVYVSPEQVRDGNAGPASDLYSFGVVLYELLTGETPFPQLTSVEELLERKLRDRVPLIGSRRPDLPSNIDMVVQQATSPSVDERFADMGELILAWRHAAGFTPGSETTSGGVGTGATSDRPRAAASRTLVSLELQSTNPYKGLAAFQEGDAADFFGRESLVDELADHLERSRFLAVVGPSGSGKSSVVRAGLVPRLRDSCYVVQMVPGTHPMDALETALLRVSPEEVPTLLEQMSGDERGVSRAIKRVVPDDADLLLVIDQFEELFTLTDPEARDQFLTAIAAAAVDPQSNVRVAVTIRADFYDRPLAHRAVSDLVRVNTVAVTPLTADELERAISGPAERVGVTIEPALVAELVNEAATAAGGLPLLQYALTQSFDARSGSGMTLDSYRGFGGISGAIAHRADELFGELSPSGKAEARRLFTRLIAPGEGTEDTRRRVPLTELSAIGSDVIDRYDAARLLSFDHDAATREPTVEVAHEALIREWPRLRAWLDEDRDGLRILRHLGASATGWENSSRDPGELYRGGRLEAAEEWASEHEADLNDTEATFLAESIAARTAEVDAERRSRRRLRRLLSGVAIVAVVALIASAVAGVQWNRANDQTAEAERQTEVAQEQSAIAQANEQAAVDAQAETAVALEVAEAERDRADETATRSETDRLAATARELAGSNDRVAMLLAVAAFERDRTGVNGFGALRDALAETSPLLQHLRRGSEFTDVEWIDEATVLVASADGLELIDIESGSALATLATSVVTRPAGWTFVSYGGFMLSADGDVGIVAIDDRTILAFETSTLTPLFEKELDADVTSVIAVEDHDLVAAANTAQDVVAWDLDGNSRFVADLGNAETAFDQAFDDFGATYSYAELLKRINVTTGLFAARDQLIAVSGAYVRSIELDGSVTDQSTTLVTERGGLRGPSVGRWWVDLGNGDAVVAGSNWYAAHDAATTAGEIATVTMDGTSGGGGDPMVSVVSRGGTPVAFTEGGLIIEFDRDSGERISEQPMNLGAPRSVHAGPTGDIAAVAHTNGVALVSLAGATPISRSIPRLDAQTHVAISPSGDLVSTGPPAVGGIPLAVWDTSGDRPVRTDLPTGEGDYFVTVHNEQEGLTFLRSQGFEELDSVRAYRYSDGQFVFDVMLDDAPPVSTWDLTDDPDDSTQLAGTWPPRVLLLNHEERLLDLDPPPGGAALSLTRFSPSEDRALIANADGSAIMYETEDWAQVHTAYLASQDIALGNWNSDGSLLATASAAGTITIRDGRSLQPVYELLGSAGSANNWDTAGGLLFSADNRLLLSNFDGQGRLWHLESRQQVGGPFRAIVGSNSGISFDGERFRLVTAAPSSAQVWNLDFDAWPAIACRAAGSNLTKAEWQQWGPRDEEYRAVCADFPIEE